MKEVHPTLCYADCMNKIRQHGIYLVTGSDAPNVMNIGWATTGVLWGKDVLMVAVRTSRYTHQKLEELPEFTVCVPRDAEAAKDDLSFVGSASGRDYEKIAELGLQTLPSLKVSVPRLADCSTVYECKVLYKLEMTEANLDPAIITSAYATGDYHTLYFGEILACHNDGDL